MTTKGVVNTIPVASTINILQMSYDDHQKWCQHYKCAIALVLALARVINYVHTMMLQIVAPLTDDLWSIIYDRKMFIIQATG
jgi:hypothetical protein